jgi:hypothetical protein
MPLWARSDLASVSVSPAHGGCGVTHTRPAPGGKPEQLWELDCHPCTDHLRHDPHWSTTLSEIPETPDEVKSREDFDRRGARDKDQVLALALAKLAGVELPESLLRPITGNMPKAIALMECPAGHPGKPGAKFCATCGEAMQQPVNALTAAPALCPEGHENPASAKFCATCGSAMAGDAPADREPANGNGRKPRLRDMRQADLAQIARERGLDDTGTRTELLDRIKSAQAAA